MFRKYVSVNRDVRNYVLGRITNSSLDTVERMVAIDSVNLGISNWTNCQ